MTSLAIPKPVIPKIDENFIESDTEEEVESEVDMMREKLYKNVANLIGFISAIGLPKKLFISRQAYYAELAYTTGVAESLIETIEYYFPDFEMSPALMLMLSLSVYASLVVTDRLTLSEEIKKMKKVKKDVKHVEEKKEEKAEMISKVKIIGSDKEDKG